MSTFAWILIAAPILLALYAYAAYPLVLWLVARLRPMRTFAFPHDWPVISISLPVYNEAAQIRSVIESLLQLDYPRDKRQIMVISDASSDDTDQIVQEYASRGVELLRLPQRVGKTAAEFAATSHLRGEIIVNTDASIRIRPNALKPLIARFNDPSIGVASGRDVSVASADNANAAEAGYVGYEMTIRRLETKVAGIIGASGCFYAVRAHLHRKPLPAHLSRDFASALIAKENGYRAVSVDEAVSEVPRTASLRREYRRKVRTLSRGMETLLHKRHLLNPLRHGVFAWMLFSHKVCRWLVPCVAPLAIAGLAFLDLTAEWARWVSLAVLLSMAGIFLLAWRWPESRPLPRGLSLLCSAGVANVATMSAALKAVHGDQNVAWEPTRRESAVPSGSTA